MGGYYARAEGLPDEVADAIRDHYKPVGQGDEVPTAPVTVAVSLADKLDTLASFFAIDERPTGSKDPFALRRAALAAIRLIIGQDTNVPLLSTFDRLWPAVRHSINSAASPAVEKASEKFSEVGGIPGRFFRASISVSAIREGYTKPHDDKRSEERRVGKECVSTCRYRWSPYH